MPTNNFLILLFMFLLVCVSIYSFYKAWFDFENLRDSQIQRQMKIPRWSPLTGYALRKLQQPRWRWEIRIVSTLQLIITIIIIGILIAKVFISR